MAQKCPCKQSKRTKAKAKPKSKTKVASKASVTSKLEQGRIMYNF